MIFFLLNVQVAEARLLILNRIKFSLSTGFFTSFYKIAGKISISKSHSICRKRIFFIGSVCSVTKRGLCSAFAALCGPSSLFLSLSLCRWPFARPLSECGSRSGAFAVVPKRSVFDDGEVVPNAKPKSASKHLKLVHVFKSICGTFE